MDRGEFERILANGYPGIDNGPAPWSRFADVDRYTAELWAYLAGRAAGEVAGGELLPAR